MIWLFIYILKVKTSTIESKEEIIITYKQELFSKNLTSFVNGNFINYSIIDSDCDTAKINGMTILEFSYMFSYNFSESDISVSMSEYTNSSTSLIMISDYNTLMLFSLDLISNAVKLNLIVSVPNITSFSNSRIQKTLLIDLIIFIHVTSTEIVDSLNITRNNLFYIDILKDYNLNEFDLWDLRYLENLQMGDSISFVLGFSVFAYNSTGAVFIYSFRDLSLPVLQQSFTSFSLNPIGDTQILKTLDLMIINKHFIILQETSVIVYFFYGIFYVESYYDDLSLYGKLYGLSYLSNQFQNPVTSKTDIIFSVNSEAGLILLDVSKQYEKGLIKQYNGNNVLGYTTGSQIYSPYIISTNYNQSLILQFTYQTQESVLYNIFSNLTALIDNININGSWLVVQGYNCYYYIRQDYDGIRIFKFNLTLPAIEIMSENSCYAIVEANELGNTSFISFYLKTLDNVYDITLVSGYKLLLLDELEFSIYFNHHSEVLSINLTNILSGWNLYFDINDYGLDKRFLFNYSIAEPVMYEAYEINSSFFKSVYVQNHAYLLNSSGIWMYGFYFLKANDPIDIDFVTINGFQYIVVLFTNEIILYDTILIPHKKYTLEFKCNFIRCKSGVIVCASNTQLVYIFSNGMKRHLNVADGNFIIDTSYYTPKNFQFEIQLILTDKGLTAISNFYNTKQSYTVFNTIGSIILTSESYVYILNPDIKVYSINSLSYLIKTIPIPDYISQASISGDILYIETEELIYIIDGLLPVLSCALTILNTAGCKLMNSQAPYLMTLCNEEFFIYNLTTISNANTIYANFTVRDIKSVNSGLYNSKLILIIRNAESIIYLPLTFHLYTYGIALFFNPISLINNSTAIEYDLNYTFNLISNMKGYNINSSLLVNGSEVAFNPFRISPFANLYPTVYESARFENITEFIDHTRFSYLNNEYIILLTNDSLVIVNYSASDYPKPGNMNYCKTISLLSLFNQSLFCSSVQLVTQSEKYALFALSCNINGTVNFYIGGYNFPLPLPKYYLGVVSISLLSLTPIAQLQELPYLPSWINAITYSKTAFSLILIDQVSINREYIYNNHMIIIQGRFLNSYYVSLEIQSVINYYTLGLDSMYAVYVDGFFESYYSSSNNILKLYVADLTYGIRMIEVVNRKATMIRGIPFISDRVVSLSVCGNLLIVLTANTNLIVYTIQQESLSVLSTYPPSPVIEYNGTNSLISCNNYYDPKYIALYFYNENKNIFKLRIINLQINFNSAVVYEQNLYNLTKNAKSLFLTNNSFSVLIFKPALIYAYYINDPYLLFPELKHNAFKEISMEKNQFTFNLSLRAVNALNISVDSPVYYITRLGLSDYSNSEIGIGYELVVIFASILMILVTVTSIVMYKALTQMKNRRNNLRAVNIEMSSDFN